MYLRMTYPIGFGRPSPRKGLDPGTDTNYMKKPFLALLCNSSTSLIVAAISTRTKTKASDEEIVEGF